MDVYLYNSYQKLDLPRLQPKKKKKKEGELVKETIQLPSLKPTFFCMTLFSIILFENFYRATSSGVQHGFFETESTARLLTQACGCEKVFEYEILVSKYIGISNYNTLWC